MIPKLTSSREMHSPDGEIRRILLNSITRKAWYSLDRYRDYMEIVWPIFYIYVGIHNAYDVSKNNDCFKRNS